MKYSENIERESLDLEIERRARLLNCNNTWATPMGALGEVLVRLDLIQRELTRLAQDFRERKK